MTDRDRAAVGLFIVGLALAALGQFTFAYRRDYVWDGVLLWAAAIVLLLAALVQVRRAERRRARLTHGQVPWWLATLGEHPIRALMVMGGLWVSFVVGVLARGRGPEDGYLGLLVLWIGAVITFVSAFLSVPLTAPALWRPQATIGRIRLWLRHNRIELTAMVVLILLALAVRAYDLEHIPANLGGDEGTQGVAGLQLVESPLGNPFATGWYSVPTMSFLAYGLSMRVFGSTVAGLRTLSALVGTATVVTTFLLARELWSRRVAWVAAVALGFGHYHVHFSRLGSNQIFDPLLITLGLWLLVRALREERAILFALAGVTIGIGWYAYFGARLVSVIAAGYVGLQAVLRHRFLRQHGRSLVVLVGAALVVVAPLILHYAVQPEALAARPRQVSIFSSGWLAREQEITGRGGLSLLLEQFWKSVSAFNYTLDPTFWYRPSIPLLDFVSGLLFILGLVWVTAHYRRPSSGLLLIWFWLALLTGWVITENPPSSQRMVLAAPALALLVGHGLDWVTKTGERIAGGQKVLWRTVATLVLMAVTVLNVGYYFLVYTPTRVYGNPTAEMATHLSRLLAAEDDDYVVYLHGPPYVYWDLGTLRFMIPQVTGVDIPPPGAEDPPQPDLSRGARFVFYGPRADELESVRDRYPGGRPEYVHSRAHGSLLYALYEMPETQE